MAELAAYTSEDCAAKMDQSHDIDPEVEEVIKEAKNPRRRLDPDRRKREKGFNNLVKTMHQGTRSEFMQALRNLGIKDGSPEFLRAVEIYDGQARD